MPICFATSSCVYPSSTIFAFNKLVLINIFSSSFCSRFGYNKTIPQRSHFVNIFFDVFSKNVDFLATTCYCIQKRYETMTIYERIKNLREEQGLSQQDLANKLGYKSRSAVNKIELGLRDISYSKVIAFANALNVSPSYLMGWDENISSLSDEELDRQILEVFNRLSDDKQKQALDYLTFLASQE